MKWEPRRGSSRVHVAYARKDGKVWTNTTGNVVWEGQDYADVRMSNGEVVSVRRGDLTFIGPEPVSSTAKAIVIEALGAAIERGEDELAKALLDLLTKQVG